MGKTLRNLIAYSMIVGSLSFLSGCWAKAEIHFGNEKPASEKTSESQESNSSSNAIGNAMTEQMKKPASKNLEDYFLNGIEIESIKPLSEESGNFEIINKADYIQKPFPFGSLISRGGVGHYIIPKIEDNSEAKDLYVEVVEFDSGVRKEDYINMFGEDNHPIFIKDNIVSVIKEDLESLSPKQKEAYENMFIDYAKRIRGEVTLNPDSLEGEFLKKAGFKIIKQNTKNISPSVDSPPNSPVLSPGFVPELRSDSASGNVSANTSTDNMTNKSVNAVTNSGLENLFLAGKESEGMNILSLEDEARLTGLPIKTLSENNLIPHYSFINCNILSGNPYIASQDDITEIQTRNGRWEMRNLIRAGEAIYFIPSGRGEEQNTGNTAFIDFAVRLYNSNAGAMEAISNGEGYTKGIDNLILTKDNAVIIISAENQINSPTQVNVYTKNMLDYLKRTNAKISALNEETRKNLEETLRKAHGAINNPSAYNFNSTDDVLEQLFGSTAESRWLHSEQSAIIRKTFSSNQNFDTNQ